MTNFDFLKNFNRELYEWGVKLEEDVINSPRAVTADATLFLETLVKDIYRLSGKKLEKKLISFYKKIDNLYRLGVISYIYKNKLKDAYNLRNKIHKNYEGTGEEEKLALDLHQRLYYISKKYFRDYCGDEIRIDIPEYKKPQHNEIHFENCIICGCENANSSSNMCSECNQKIDHVNILLTIRNSFKDSRFTKSDLINYGFSESETIALLVDLSKQNVILKKGEFYVINDENFNKLFNEVDQFIEIGLLLTRFYNDEITPKEIRNTLEYWKGGIGQKYYGEFYRLVNLKLEDSFEENILKLEDIKKSMNASSMDSLNLRDWFKRRKESFIKGDLNDAFIMFNELLINEYFNLKKKNLPDVEIKAKLDISDEVIEFWRSNFMSDEFMKKTNEIKKGLIIKEIKKNKTLKEIFKLVGVSQKEFDRLYMSSKNSNDSFHKEFDMYYTQKRQKTLIKHLKKDNLNKAIKISKITKEEFYSWYWAGEIEYDDFYIKTTEILMDKYLTYRMRGWHKQDILKRLNIPKGIFRSWYRQKDLDIIIDFERKNEEITQNIVKRGKIINALKEDKSKLEAIQGAGLTVEEFQEIYETSKLQKTDFHKRFDHEYEENRKRLFCKLLKGNDFYNAIRLCEITQKQFNSWYIKDQDSFIATNEPTYFYLDTTKLLMEKYIQARRQGKNKPDASKSVGLSNTIIDKWLRHVEFDLYWDFKRKNDKLEMELVTQGFRDMKSKLEVSEIYDVSINTINEFLSLGKNGFEGFEGLAELYENHVVPALLEIFIDNIKTKTFNKSLKNSRLTEKELTHYYMLGKSGDQQFKSFYDDFMNIKIGKYVKSILSKKSHKIAIKNSDLTINEYNEKRAEIEDMILNSRFNIIYANIGNLNSSGTKLANIVGVDLEEIYEWYFKGKEGQEKYRQFALTFEIGVILPRIMAFDHAKSKGLSKNWLNKQLKKNLGSREYEIWVKYNFLSGFDLRNIKVNDEGIDMELIKSIFKNSNIVTESILKEDSDVFDFFKKAFSANKKLPKISINVANEISGK